MILKYVKDLKYLIYLIKIIPRGWDEVGIETGQGMVFDIMFIDQDRLYYV